MKEKTNNIDRRNFLRKMGAVGVGSIFASVESLGDVNEPNDKATSVQEKEIIPKRKLGKTGVEIPCLGLGSGASRNEVLQKAAFDRGVTYWDTSYVAGGGNSELGIGKYLLKNPEVRKKMFLVTKESESKNASDMEKCLQTSLQRMNTKYVDLYLGVYMMSEPSQLTDEVKRWAESAKKRKLIRFFGFSTHKNMAGCLKAAAKVGWVDAVMTMYNFRLMQDDQMQEAVEACYDAGVGVIAMKTQGKPIENEDEKKLVEHFLKRGFTQGQAKIKMVLEDKRISTACVTMNDVELLNSNIAAVLDKKKLTQDDKSVMKEYAEATCNGYCAGCANICGSVLPEMSYVSDIMRYLMYYNSYDEKAEAKELFAKIPGKIRNRLVRIDYSKAESQCPHRIPISRLMAKAVIKLS